MALDIDYDAIDLEDSYLGAVYQASQWDNPSIIPNDMSIYGSRTIVDNDALDANEGVDIRIAQNDSTINASIFNQGPRSIFDRILDLGGNVVGRALTIAERNTNPKTVNTRAVAAATPNANMSLTDWIGSKLGFRSGNAAATPDVMPLTTPLLLLFGFGILALILMVRK